MRLQNSQLMIDDTIIILEIREKRVRTLGDESLSFTREVLMLMTAMNAACDRWRRQITSRSRAQEADKCAAEGRTHRDLAKAEATRYTKMLQGACLASVLIMTRPSPSRPSHTHTHTLPLQLPHSYLVLVNYLRRSLCRAAPYLRPASRGVVSILSRVGRRVT